MNPPCTTDWLVENPLYAADLRRARELRAGLLESSGNVQHDLLDFLSAASFPEQKKWRLRQCAAIAISTLDSPQLMAVIQALDGSVQPSAWKHSGNPLGAQMMPLTCAVQFAKIDVLDFLLQRLNPNERCISGDTALATAMSCGWQEGARRLVQVTDLRAHATGRPYQEIAAIHDDAEMENWRVPLIETELSRRSSLRESRSISAVVAEPTIATTRIKKTI